MHTKDCICIQGIFTDHRLNKGLSCIGFPGDVYRRQDLAVLDVTELLNHWDNFKETEWSCFDGPGTEWYKNKKRPINIDLFCGPTWTRTMDHLIMSQVL